MLAIPNSSAAVGRAHIGNAPECLPLRRGSWLCHLFAACLIIQTLLMGRTAFADGANDAHAKAKYGALVQKTYNEAKAVMARDNTSESKWKFARACFDWADFNTSESKKETIAQEAVKACRSILDTNPSSAEAHYYLAMNLGEVAETKTLGALRIVSQMETEFKTALRLNPDFDYAGPNRNLGMLYLQAPGWPASIGSNSKSKEHLEAAVKLAPEYPENLLNLAEAQIGWGDKSAAAKLLDDLDKVWPKEQKILTGPAWEQSWLDWDDRRKDARQKITATPKVVKSPRDAAQR